jgi:hypothetical protein
MAAGVRCVFVVVVDATSGQAEEVSQHCRAR